MTYTQDIRCLDREQQQRIVMPGQKSFFKEALDSASVETHQSSCIAFLVLGMKEVAQRSL
jgi:hypothetical protein